MKHKGYEIVNIEPSGVLAECGVQEGDRVLSINAHPVLDELDIMHADMLDALLLEIEKPDGEIVEIEIEKENGEPLGLSTDGSGLGIRRCTNRCIFCFIDQMPKGMRETLYVKDDDERLSFLQGNYVSLTNLNAEMKKRIVEYRLMPLNISIHTTDPLIRCQMLNNRFASTIMEDLKYFSDRGIMMNGQIVLCPGYNDGDHLKNTLKDLMSFYPALQTVSVVPVGLTRFREGLCPLQGVDASKASETIEIITECQTEMLDLYQTRFVYPGDELFLAAELPIPKADYYEDFAQIENGVGLIADFKESLSDALETCARERFQTKRIGIITGLLAASFMEECASLIEKKYPEAQISVFPITNQFFGEAITVSGLVTGKDIISQILKEENMDYYLIPDTMVRYQTEILLDDCCIEEIADALNASVLLIESDGAALADAILAILRSEN